MTFCKLRAYQLVACAAIAAVSAANAAGSSCNIPDVDHTSDGWSHDDRTFPEFVTLGNSTSFLPSISKDCGSFSLTVDNGAAIDNVSGTVRIQRCGITTLTLHNSGSKYYKTYQAVGTFTTNGRLPSSAYCGSSIPLPVYRSSCGADPATTYTVLNGKQGLDYNMPKGGDTIKFLKCGDYKVLAVNEAGDHKESVVWVVHVRDRLRLTSEDASLYQYPISVPYNGYFAIPTFVSSCAGTNVTTSVKVIDVVKGKDVTAEYARDPTGTMIGPFDVGRLQFAVTAKTACGATRSAGPYTVQFEYDYANW